MKKFFAIILSVLTVALLFSGCGEEKSVSSNQSVASAESSSKVEVSSKQEVFSKTEPSSSKKPTSSKEPTSSMEDSGNNELHLTPYEKMIYGVDPDMLTLGVKEKGNTARIANFMKKAQKGGSYTIAVLGGSISQGASASSGNSYGNILYDWFKSTFPKASFKFVNAGIGATNPEMACYRMEEDLLKYNPDFVVVDFAVNTYLDNDVYSTYSSILYRILSSQNSPAALAIDFTSCDQTRYAMGIYKAATNYPCNAIYDAIKKYDIPEISYHNYIWNKINKGIVKYYQVGADYIHPNDDGHRIAANLISTYLESILKNLSAQPTKITAPQKPSYKKYLAPGYITNKSSEVVSCTGFEKGNNTSPIARGWTSVANATGELKIKLKGAKAVYLFIHFTGDAVGNLSVSGDGGNRFISKNDAATPTLVRLSAGTDYTLTSNMTAGSFTIYGIGYDK